MDHDEHDDWGSCFYPGCPCSKWTEASSSSPVAISEAIASASVQYLVVMGAPKALIMARIPWKRVPWQQIITALTPVMHTHGGLVKDMHLDGLLPMEEPMDEQAIEMRHRLEEAFAGNKHYFGFFHLYDWRDKSFVLARSAAAEV